MRLKFSKIQLKNFFQLYILLWLVGVLIGFFLTTQWRAKPSRITSSLLPYTSLREARNILQAENTELKKQISDLHNKINETQAVLKQTKITSASSIDALERLKDKVGLKEKTGPGISIILADSPRISSYNAIVHASDLRDLINLLWASGASAIAINNQRISFFTSIDCIVNTILINNVRLTSPFLIQAIGDPKRLKAGIESGLIDLHERKKYGLKFEVEQNPRITIPAFNGSYSIQYARIKE